MPSIRRPGAARVALALALFLSDCKGTSEPRLVATTIVVSPSTTTLFAVGRTQQFTAVVKDQSGGTMAGVGVTWGSSNAGVATVAAASGLATAAANGTAQISATAGTATGSAIVTVAQVAAQVTKVSGDSQSTGAGQALPQPLVVRVADSTAHPVPGAMVTFTVAAGGGSVGSASVPTDTGGRAQTTWTLGSGAQVQALTATAPGPAVAGNPIQFRATASGAAIASVQPDTLVEGQSATLTGFGFSTVAAADSVTIDGVPAAVGAATATSLTVAVPSSTCLPARAVTVTVKVAGQSASKTGVPLHPTGFTTLAVGQQAITQDPSAFCLQLRAASAGPEAYLIGLSAPAEAPGSVLPFLITAAGGIAAASPALADRPAAPAIAWSRPRRGLAGSALVSGGTAGDGQWMTGRLRHLRAEAQLRGWERANLPRLVAQARRPRPVAAMVSGAAAGAPPAVGDTVVVRFPNLAVANGCTTYDTLKTVARAVGSAGIFLYDVQNPTADSLTQADIQAASDLFDAKIFASDTTHFGHPTDLDANGHIFIVLTWQVNRIPAGYDGFVFTGDLFPGASCPQSNDGEYYYGEVPDSLNQAGPGARPKSYVLGLMGDLIAHEFTHLIQVSQRLIFNAGQLMPSWEMEGQAVFAEELAGDAALGRTSYQNYGRNVAFAQPGYQWYSGLFLYLDLYFGNGGPDSANAPDLCTVYGSTQIPMACDRAAFYGSSWVFQRYIADQIGPAYPGGLVQLTRDWVMKSPSLVGTANIQALTGVNYDTLFARFATALAVDDKDYGGGTAWIPPSLSITSWDTDSVATWLSSCCRIGWLAPASMNFGTASVSRSVRGGSTAYTMLSASAAHPAEAIKFTDPVGAALSAALRPALWILRVR